MSNTGVQPLAPFPPDIDFETVKILKALLPASRALAELKGTAMSLPHQGVLTTTLLVQEAIASSKIEGIVTIQDDVFRADLFTHTGTAEAKEVARYRSALRLGYDAWCEQQSISSNMLIVMFQELTRRSNGYRQIPGTVLRNQRTGATVYTPPQDAQQIVAYMRDLEAFINDHITDHKHDDIDPLIKMALIHHQFESIHPFHDGNGRIGRILNVLYLIHTGLLDVPILYLSWAINRTKPEYYRLLQAVRNEGAWEDWIVYMLDAVTVTAQSTLKLVTDIRSLMWKTKHRMRKELKFYSQDLLNNLFHHPYTRIDYVARDIGVHYNTAASHLKKLTAIGIVREQKYGTRKYYVNQELINLFLDVSEEAPTLDWH